MLKNPSAFHLQDVKMAETGDVERAPSRAANEDTNEEPETEPTERVIIHLSLFWRERGELSGGKWKNS